MAKRGNNESVASSLFMKGEKMDKITCKNCGAILNNDAIFCTECGTKIQNELKIRTVEDFSNIELYDEIVRTGAPLQSEEELKAIIENYNKNVNMFKKKGVRQLLLLYKTNLKFSQKRLGAAARSQENVVNPQNEYTQEGINKFAEEEAKLEEKFGTQFHGKRWFRCTLEERRYSTFSNTNDRRVETGYIILNDDYLEICKEGVFIKSNLGSRKVYLKNVASIDFDKRGIFDLSSSVVINFKSSEFVELKNISKEDAESLVELYEDFINRDNAPVNNTVSSADELMKYAELYEKGLLTEEEFNQVKKDILNS